MMAKKILPTKKTSPKRKLNPTQTRINRRIPVAFVSGGTSGIGLETARSLWQEGYQVIICGRRSERLAAIEKESKGRCRGFRLDVTRRQEVEKFVQEQGELLQNLEVIVNNAGLARGRDPFPTASLDDFEVMISTNVMGLLYVTKSLLPFLIKKNQGHIINIGSVAGRWVYPGGSVYCASKFAVSALSEGLRMDLFGKRIRLTNIAPGMVETEFSLARFGDAEKARAVYQGMTPLTALDIAESILWCLKRPAHVNIQELVIFPTDQVSVTQVHRKSD